MASIAQKAAVNLLSKASRRSFPNSNRRITLQHALSSRSIRLNGRLHGRFKINNQSIRYSSAATGSTKKTRPADKRKEGDGWLDSSDIIDSPDLQPDHLIPDPQTTHLEIASQQNTIAEPASFTTIDAHHNNSDLEDSTSQLGLGPNGSGYKGPGKSHEEYIADAPKYDYHGSYRHKNEATPTKDVGEVQKQSSCNTKTTKDNLEACSDDSGAESMASDDDHLERAYRSWWRIDQEDHDCGDDWGG